MKAFDVTQAHLKLLDRMWTSWFDCEYGAPSIDPKRPYGNSNVTNDIAEILGWAIPDYDEDEDFTDDQYDAARKIHTQMEIVLQILIDNRGIEEATYYCDGWGKGWKLHD